MQLETATILALCLQAVNYYAWTCMTMLDVDLGHTATWDTRQFFWYNSELTQVITYDNVYEVVVGLAIPYVKVNKYLH